jgi:RimJ/RimL family protein N-acetyltransferase
MSALKVSAIELEKYVLWGWEIKYWTMANFGKHVSNYINSPTDHAFVCYFRDTCLGFGDIVENGDFAQLALWVRSDHQGVGVGEFMVSELEKYAFEDLGFEELHYIHNVKNIRSERLAKKCGYEIKTTLGHPSFDKDCEIVMSKHCERYKQSISQSNAIDS